MPKSNIDVKAKMVDSNKFEIIFAMDEQTIRSRLILICEKIEGLEKSRELLEEQLELLVREKSQIELSLNQKQI
jgi:hypothetical protein